MKSGLTIVEMAQQIERQSKLKQDYLLDTRRLQVEPFGSQLYLHTFDDHDDPLVEPLEINQIAHRQIGTHLKIPAAYYDRMLSDYPELLAENVNSWFQREPTQRMVRTLDGTVRAFLSNGDCEQLPAYTICYILSGRPTLSHFALLWRI